MVARPPDWQEIYEKTLHLKYYGVPLWNPQPSSPANLVNIGDVGYIYKGEFYRIFNATKKDDKYCGNAKPLSINYAVDVKKSTREPLPMVSEGIIQMKDEVPNSYTFTTTKIRGAMLIPLSNLTEEILEPAKEAEWKRYMARNLDDWPEPEVCNRRELRLVYGRVTAAKWLSVVFEMQKSTHSSWRFSVSIPEDVGSEPEFRTFGCEFSSPPNYRRGADVLSILDPKSDAPSSHCIFLRGYQPTKSRGVLGWKVEDTLPYASLPNIQQGTKLKAVVLSILGMGFKKNQKNKVVKDSEDKGTHDQPPPADNPNRNHFITTMPVTHVHVQPNFVPTCFQHSITLL